MDRKPGFTIDLIPLKNADHQKVLNSKSNPLQKLIVNRNNTLASISEFIKRLVKQDVGVQLYYLGNNVTVSFPLSFKISEFQIITKQGDPTEVRYSFVDPPVIQQRLPDPQVQPQTQIQADIEPQFTFSNFSNSFGMFSNPYFQNSFSIGATEKTDTDEHLSLRSELQGFLK